MIVLPENLQSPDTSHGFTCGKHLHRTAFLACACLENRLSRDRTSNRTWDLLDGSAEPIFSSRFSAVCAWYAWLVNRGIVIGALRQKKPWEVRQ